VQHSPFTPRFTVSTSSSLPRALDHYLSLASDLGAAGVDLDLTTWVGRRRPGLKLGRTGDNSLGLSSVWISSIDLEAVINDVAQKTDPIVKNLGARGLLAVRLPGNEESGADYQAAKSAHDALSVLPWAAKAVIVVPAAAPEGGRAHITRLRALRRVAEEWDVDIGFDLTSATDARWEAEVAVQIADPRLSLIRLIARLPNVSSTLNDVYGRTLIACGDLGFDGTVSLAPTTPLWLNWHSSSVRRDLEHNRDIMHRIFTERRVLQRLFQTPHR